MFMRRAVEFQEKSVEMMVFGKRHKFKRIFSVNVKCVQCSKMDLLLVHQRSYGKVMFSLVSVCLFTGGPI